MPVQQVFLNHQITHCLRTRVKILAFTKRQEPITKEKKVILAQLNAQVKRMREGIMESLFVQITQSGLVHRKSHRHILICISMLVFFLVMIVTSDDNLKFSSFAQVIPMSTRWRNKAENHTKNSTKNYYQRIIIKRVTNL